MSSATKQKPVQQIALPPQRPDISAAVEECLERTATILLHLEAATQAELIHALDVVRKGNTRGTPIDLLETLALHLGGPETELPQKIAVMADKISTKLYPSPPLVPFAGKFIAPNAFYDKFPELVQLGRALQSPVIYAEDSDAIGTAALNPVAASIMAEEITAVVARRSGIRPFVTAVVLTYPSWQAIVRKHFSL